MHFLINNAYRNRINITKILLLLLIKSYEKLTIKLF